MSNLTKKLDVDETVENYLKSIRNLKSLPKKVEYQYILDYKLNNNIESRNIVISANLKYACGLANAYRGKGVDFAELIAVANDGLMEAIEKYDIKENTKFLTYAKWSIIQRILYAINKNYKHSGFAIPTEKDIQEDDDEIPLTNNNDYDALIVDDIDSEHNKMDIKLYIEKLLNNLTERERDIVSRYYGLYGTKENLFDISDDYNLTSERIRQIMEGAMKKIRSIALCA
jgi:RNA polymerase sigma factor (sigma-70 family)